MLGKSTENEGVIDPWSTLLLFSVLAIEFLTVFDDPTPPHHILYRAKGETVFDGEF